MIWLIGNKGMLGSQIERLLRKENIHFYGSDREVDITIYDKLDAFIENKKINLIINCSAYTAVDKAETDLDKVYSINVTGVENIAKIAQKYNISIIHFSTDYVFDGLKKSPYSEEDIPMPLSVYGKTKFEGETAIQKHTEKYFIFRISWLYGVYGPNFVKTIVRLLNDKTELKVINDQIGSPTYCGILAQNIINLIKSDSNLYGIYHYSDEGIISWYDFACKIEEITFKRNVIIKKIPILPIPASQYKTVAVRPINSSFNKMKVKNNLNFILNDWDKNLELYFDELFNQICK